ncbi:MAG: tetratricopeptide repeat protein [Caulobacteraceae bacterium]
MRPAAAELERARSAEADQGRMNALLSMDYAGLRAVLTGEDADEWVESAARRGLPAAQLRLGRMLLARGQAAEALSWFERAAALGEGEAMNMAGRAFELGWGVETDLDRVARWYRASAEAGCAWGEYNLAGLLFDGRGVARDLEAAVALYARAAAKGHARAMNLLARCLEEGWGRARDPAAASQWYRRSAEAGYFRGQINHALVLAEQGRREEAAAWMETAARSRREDATLER